MPITLDKYLKYLQEPIVTVYWKECQFLQMKLSGSVILFTPGASNFYMKECPREGTQARYWRDGTTILFRLTQRLSPLCAEFCTYYRFFE